MAAGDLGGHEVDIVIACDCEQEISFAHPGFALYIDVDAVALEQLYTFKLRCATEAGSFFIYDSDLVASF
jgi:hypothetical protein